MSIEGTEAIEGVATDHPLSNLTLPLFHRLRTHPNPGEHIWANNDLHLLSIVPLMETTEYGFDVQVMQAECRCGWLSDTCGTGLGPPTKRLIGMYSSHLQECYRAEESARIEYLNKLLTYVADTAENTKYLRGILEGIKLPAWLLKTNK